MIRVLEKIGNNKKVLSILADAGWNGSYPRFMMQKQRGKLSTDVSLILWEYCLNHKIPVSRKDFYKGE